MDSYKDPTECDSFLAGTTTPELPTGELCEPQGSSDSPLIDIKQFAAKLVCSVKHVRRLADEGRCPPPIRLGKLVRWNRETVDSWIADNCPVIRPVRASRRK
jgi:excisionase family DNA binding protein